MLSPSLSPFHSLLPLTLLEPQAIQHARDHIAALVPAAEVALQRARRKPGKRRLALRGAEARVVVWMKRRWEGGRNYVPNTSPSLFFFFFFFSSLNPLKQPSTPEGAVPAGGAPARV